MIHYGPFITRSILTRISANDVPYLPSEGKPWFPLLDSTSPMYPAIAIVVISMVVWSTSLWLMQNLYTILCTQDFVVFCFIVAVFFHQVTCFSLLVVKTLPGCFTYFGCIFDQYSLTLWLLCKEYLSVWYSIRFNTRGYRLFTEFLSKAHQSVIKNYWVCWSV